MSCIFFFLLSQRKEIKIWVWEYGEVMFSFKEGLKLVSITIRSDSEILNDEELVEEKGKRDVENFSKFSKSLSSNSVNSHQEKAFGSKAFEVLPR